jgi:hypothetical protein
MLPSSVGVVLQDWEDAPHGAMHQLYHSDTGDQFVLQYSMQLRMPCAMLAAEPGVSWEQPEATFTTWPFWERPEAFLVLLHEAGHVAAFGRLTPQQFSVQTEYREALESGEVYLDDEEEFPDWVQHCLRPERDAWAWAIQKLRALRDRGIDLAPELPRSADVLQFVHLHLASHALPAILEMSDAAQRRFVEQYNEAIAGSPARLKRTNHLQSRC